jgi:transposase
MKPSGIRHCSRKAASPHVLSITRKPYRSDGSDVHWDYLRPLLPKGARTGGPRAHEREILNGILYVLKTGCQWEDLPHDIAAVAKTCHRRLLDYQRRRVWQKIVQSCCRKRIAEGTRLGGFHAKHLCTRSESSWHQCLCDLGTRIAPGKEALGKGE